MPSTGPGRVVLVTGAALLAVLVLAAAFVAGALARRSAPEARATPARTAAPVVRVTPTATPTPPPAPAPRSGPASPGAHPWTELHGGECLDPFESAWAATFTVVPCRTKHAAQLTRLVTLQGEQRPSDSVLIDRLSLACTGSGALDLGRARAYDDLKTSFSYPTSSDWTAGRRSGACFVSRGGGITGDLRP
jgi:Septum formation